MERKEENEGDKKLNVELRKELLGAAERGDAERVRVLLRCEGVDPRCASEMDMVGRDKTSLCLACEKGHVETARVLLDHGGETQEDLGGAFYGPASSGHVLVVKLLLERGADPTLENNEAVRLAAANGYCELVETLLSDPRVDPAAKENEALRHAAKNGHTEVVELLLRDKRVDPAATDNWAVGMASINGHFEVVKTLLRDSRVNPAADDNYAARLAAVNGHSDVLELLLADERVDGTMAINGAHSRTLPVLFEDERCGININRALFERYRGWEVLRYEELVRERTARICAVSWAMKQIGEGWGDLREPLEGRMQKQPVDWGLKCLK